MKDVAVVILNWNGRELLKKFLPSVTEHSGDARIIIADNASSDDSINFIKENYPQVEIVQNKSNGGFAKGYNDALAQIDAKYYLLLNSDVEVTKGWIEPLLEQVKKDGVAAAQPKILSYHEKHKFEHAGACGGYIDKNYFPFCRGRLFEHVEEDTHQYDTTDEVFWTSGAAMLVCATVFHDAGGFDEDFFAHMEEIDLCWRMKKLDKKLMVVPSSVVYHVGGATLAYSSPRKVYLNFKNSLMMIFKNHEGPVFGKLFWRMSLDGVAGLRFLVKGEFKQFWAVFRSHMWLYGNMGSLITKRKEVKKNTKRFNSSGLYTGNIVWHHYAKNLNSFAKLDQRLFRK